MKDAVKKDIQAYYAWWRRMNDLYVEWARAHGLSSFSLFVLDSLYGSENGCTQKQICRDWMLPKQTVNSILKGFEEKGYITSRVSEEDKRKRLIFLTGEGMAYGEAIISELRGLEERIMEKMGKEKREAMNEGAFLYCRLFQEETGGMRT